MKAIDQTLVCKGFGNCMQAVLASLFEKELTETINVMELPEDKWHIPFMNWIESIGYDYVGVMNSATTKKETYSDLRSQVAVKDYFYAVVPSKNFKKCSHAVIIDRNGVVAHDPNPKKQWQGIDVVESGDLQYWYRFEPQTA